VSLLYKYPSRFGLVGASKNTTNIPFSGAGFLDAPGLSAKKQTNLFKELDYTRFGDVSTCACWSGCS
jgi:hypothetical protein